MGRGGHLGEAQVLRAQRRSGRTSPRKSSSTQSSGISRCYSLGWGGGRRFQAEGMAHRLGIQEKTWKMQEEPSVISSLEQLLLTFSAHPCLFVCFRDLIFRAILVLHSTHTHSHSHTAPSAPSVSYTCTRLGGTFVTTDEPMLTHHDHSEFIVYIRIYSWWSTFCGFGQTYNDV